MGEGAAMMHAMIPWCARRLALQMKAMSMMMMMMKVMSTAK